MKKVLALLLVSGMLNAKPVIISQHEWVGEYVPSTAQMSYKNWGTDIHTSTIATVGEAKVNQLTYGWAIFRIHVHPGWAPFQCSITKSVCMLGNQQCNNLTTNMLFQFDSYDEIGTYEDDLSYSSAFTYKTPGVYGSSSHVYMDRCGGPQFSSHSTGTITVKG